MKKICACCKEEKEVTSFVKDKYAATGYKSYCKPCCNAKNKEKRDKDREKYNEYALKWRKKNRQYCNDVNAFCRGKILELKTRGRYTGGREAEEARSYIKKYKSSYDRKNRDKINAYNRLPEQKAKKNKYRRNREKHDLNYRLRSRIRGRISGLVRANKMDKKGRSLLLLGCTIEELRVYLESLFQSGMTWENNGNGEGKWNIDHIIPCAVFDLTQLGEQLKCFNYKNLQPKWWKENLNKSDKITDLVEGLDFSI